MTLESNEHTYKTENSWHVKLFGQYKVISANEAPSVTFKI